jgi:hypothetical protein
MEGEGMNALFIIAGIVLGVFTSMKCEEWERPRAEERKAKFELCQQKCAPFLVSYAQDECICDMSKKKVGDADE